MGREPGQHAGVAGRAEAEEQDQQPGPRIAQEAPAGLRGGQAQAGAGLQPPGQQRERGERRPGVEPTIFDGVTNAMKIAREEIFG
ncbi:aldehyde dehydrogenase family protein, partial [Pseudomonas aeruginosa]|uniref:aldehyde dehydrogenase family protein n=1 Tax=Pseudomonas aeruginosa TaxID=287 RepID=UPI003C6DC5B2